MKSTHDILREFTQQVQRVLGKSLKEVILYGSYARGDYRLQQAKESLKVAKTCMSDECYKDSINRSYYSVFYAIKAVLALGTVDFKRHKDVVAHPLNPYRYGKTYVETSTSPNIGVWFANVSE